MPQTTITYMNGKSKFTEFKEFGRFRFIEANLVKDPKTGSEYVDKVFVRQSRLLEFVQILGFRSIIIENSRFLVRIDNNIIEPVTIQDIRQKVMNYINSLEFMVHHLDPYLTDSFHHDMIKEKFANGIERFFNKSYIHTQLYLENSTFNQHSHNTAYFYYKNTAVKVTASEITLVPYSELPGLIWKSQIIDREFSNTKPTKKGMFEKFVDLVTGTIDSRMKHHPNNGKKTMLRCQLGYLCHNYHAKKSKMVVLTDDSLQEDQGRTGKGLILGDPKTGALKHFLGGGWVWVNGKKLDMNKDQSFSAANIDSVVMHIDDINKKYTGKAVDMLFPLITGGIESKRVYQDPVILTLKIAASTNKIIDISKDSVKDRVWLLPLCRYFNADRSPENIFKVWFFSDEWIESEWFYFDYFMVQNLQYWFKNGFYTVDELGINEQVLSQSFDQYIQDFIEDELDKIPFENDNKKFGGLAYKELHIKNSLALFLGNCPKGRNYSYLDTQKWRYTLERYCMLKKQYMSHSDKNKAEHPKLYRQSGRDYYLSFVSIV